MPLILARLMHDSYSILMLQCPKPMDLSFLQATLPELIQSVGYIGIFIIVFLESGVPLGIILPLPGDTLLFSAGLLAASSVFDLVPLLLTVVVAAILGDSVGYWFGAKYGRKIFSKETGFFLHKSHITRAEMFFEKYGRSAIILARFIPMLRTIIPITAGIGHMRYEVFIRYNIIGAVIWAVTVTLLGYYLGSLIPNIDHYLLPILGIIILISIITTVLQVRTAKIEEITKTSE